uniref:Uncharacterized protein n=1 Tax=Romanomermis culicivorax TaxID=13658 RepID=A0A915I125_ROMCU
MPKKQIERYDRHDELKCSANQYTSTRLNLVAISSFVKNSVANRVGAGSKLCAVVLCRQRNMRNKGYAVEFFSCLAHVIARNFLKKCRFFTQKIWKLALSPKFGGWLGAKGPVWLGPMCNGSRTLGGGCAIPNCISLHAYCDCRMRRGLVSNGNGITYSGYSLAAAQLCRYVLFMS